jgi:rhodanese-related sulfurtransferase
MTLATLAPAKPGTSTTTNVRHAWRVGAEIALLDAREEAAYADAHPFFAVSLALSRIEADVRRLIPRFRTPIVVYDQGEGLAEKAASRLRELGYDDVRILEGGLDAYAAEGELFRDVNVPSKAFGELVEAIRHTPSLSAPEVQALLDADPDALVLDARRFEEYQTMSIPRGISVPGGDLGLRAFDLVESAPGQKPTVVVNCAGRTRSIIGAQTLVNLGLPARVIALRNGTIGWTLAGYALDRGRGERAPATSGRGREAARAAARAWAARVGIRTIDTPTLDRWVAESDTRTLYRFDVRGPEEYQAGHLPGFVSAPGGQLVQATDEWVAVRGARIVLVDDDGVRAPVTATWLAQMGWDVAVLETSAPFDERSRPSAARVPPPELHAHAITAQELVDLSGNADRIGHAADIVDLANSRDYLRGHIPGAQFLLRSRIEADIPRLGGTGPIVLTSPDGDLAAHAWGEVRAVTPRDVLVLSGGSLGWLAAGLALTQEPRWLSTPNDLYRRPYEGTDHAAAAMQAYIDWELQLVAQLANDGVSNFHVVR